MEGKKGFRLNSVDALRGLAMSVMIFNSYNYWGEENLRHISWGGMNLADYELPAFILVLGFAKGLYFDHNSSKNSIKDRCNLLGKAAIRMIILIFLGLCYNGMPTWNIQVIRIPGVLFRLGIIDFLISLIMLFVPRLNAVGHLRDISALLLQWLAVLSLLAAYLSIIFFLPVPNCPVGYLGPGGRKDGEAEAMCTGGATYYIDQAVFGENHLQHYPPCASDAAIQCLVHFDDLGLLGVLSACFNAFLGVQAAETYLTFVGRAQDKSLLAHWSVVLRWLAWAAGLAAVTAGLTLGNNPLSADQSAALMPVVKSLWTPSFACLNGSLDLLILCVLFAVSDVPFLAEDTVPEKHSLEDLDEAAEPLLAKDVETVKPVQKRGLWNGNPFRAMGRNSIGAYLGSRFCYTWIPIAFPAFFALSKFSRPQLSLSSLFVDFIFLAVCYILERKKLFYSFGTR